MMSWNINAAYEGYWKQPAPLYNRSPPSLSLSLKVLFVLPRQHFGLPRLAFFSSRVQYKNKCYNIQRNIQPCTYEHIHVSGHCKDIKKKYLPTLLIFKMLRLYFNPTTFELKNLCLNHRSKIFCINRD